MMHGHEKSDPAIVARKPVNKAARSATEPSVKEPAAAESVERRAGTKGNADQRSTYRTQSRTVRTQCRPSVSQELGRIRQEASDRPAVIHLRWEPCAGKPHARFCAGGVR